MSGRTESLPMDVAEDARWQQEKQQEHKQEHGQEHKQEHGQEHDDHKKELDQNELVRARLLTISQVPEGQDLPLGPLADINPEISPRVPNPRPDREDREDEFRRKLMSVSYVDVSMSAQ